VAADCGGGWPEDDAGEAAAGSAAKKGAAKNGIVVGLPFSDGDDEDNDVVMDDENIDAVLPKAGGTANAAALFAQETTIKAKAVAIAMLTG